MSDYYPSDGDDDYNYGDDDDDDDDRGYARSCSGSPRRYDSDERSRGYRSPSPCNSSASNSDHPHRRDSDDDEHEPRHSRTHREEDYGIDSPIKESNRYPDDDSEEMERYEEPPYLREQNRGRARRYDSDSDDDKPSSGMRFSERKPFGDYTVTGRGVNEEGNRWSTRDYPKYPDEKPFHYSNRDGGYYYDNPDGSRYYNDGRGTGHYQPPGRDKWYKCRKG